MESFVSGRDPAVDWNESLQNELVRLTEDALKGRRWKDVEVLAIASRAVSWRDPLSDDRVLKRLVERAVAGRGQADFAAPIDLVAPAMRLAVNCCIGSVRVHELLSAHLDDIQALLFHPPLADIGFGALANLLYDEISVVTLADLVEDGFQASVADWFLEADVQRSHPMFDTALELLEELSEEDVEIGVPNAERTRSAMESIRCLVTGSLSSADEDTMESFVRILLRWASKRDLRLPSKGLADVYETYLKTIACSEPEIKHDGGAANSLLVPFESILGELAAERSEASEPERDLFEPVSRWIDYRSTIKNSTKANRLSATGFLILCNLCTEPFAIRAVQDLRLHERAVSVLRDKEKRKVPVLRKNAAAFLGNLCQPAVNRSVILDSNIVSELFYDTADIDVEIPIRFVRRLVGGGFAPAASLAIDPERKGMPEYKHVLEQLPDQKLLMDELAKTKSEGEGFGQTPTSIAGEQMTRDIAHIYVDMRRFTLAANNCVTQTLVWALVNLVLIGLRTKNALDMSEGIFGLGLVLQGENGTVDKHAEDAVEALTHWEGLEALEQIIHAAKTESAKEADKKVADNAVSIVARLVEVVERKDLSVDLSNRLREVLRLGLEEKK